jgi:hypothetical protein
MRILFTFFLCVFIFSINGYTQSVSKDSIQKDYIEFGKGGGFSGAVNGYILTKDGILYKVTNCIGDNNCPIDFIKNVKKSAVRKIFKYADKNKLLQTTYNQPGNTYSYITLSINRKKQTIIWGSTSDTPPQTITELSSKLFNLL